MRTNTMRFEHREQLMPLFLELRKRLDKELLVDLARRVGLPIWQVSRVLGAATASPNYLDMTKLIVASGMTPNEAASLAGLYQTDNELNDAERRIRRLLTDPDLSDEVRERALFLVETYLAGEKAATLKAASPWAKTVGERPITKPKSRARVG